MTTTYQTTDPAELYAAATADIPGDASDEEVDRLLHERTVAERTFMMQAAPALLAERSAAHHDLCIAVGDSFTTLNSAAFEATRQIAFLRSDVERLTAERDQARRGAQELGKSVVFLGELIKDAYVRGADDPIDALQMLGNVLAEIDEDEGGLSPDEFNRVHQALRDRRAAEERAQAERDAAERESVAAAVRRGTEPTT